MEVCELLHVLRNPHGKNLDELRACHQEAADLIEENLARIPALSGSETITATEIHDRLDKHEYWVGRNVREIAARIIRIENQIGLQPEHNSGLKEET